MAYTWDSLWHWCRSGRWIVARIDTNAIGCPTYMPCNDLLERGEQLFQQRLVACRREVTSDGVEHPQRGIHSIILGRFTTVGKTIGNKPFVSKRREGFEQATRLAIPTRREQQARQRNHTITSPVRKPGVACDNRFPPRRQVQLPVSIRVIRVLCTSSDELISGINQASRYRIASRQVACCAIGHGQELLGTPLAARQGLYHIFFVLRSAKLAACPLLSAQHERHPLSR